MVSMRPGINRFVAGRRIYARNNIEVVLTVRRTMSTTSNETTIKAVFAPTDTEVDVLALDRLALTVELDRFALGAEGDEHRQGAEVIQVVIDRRDAEDLF